MPPRGSSELDRFYLQLLADFSGQILVRSMSRIAGLAVTAILMSCAINGYVAHRWLGRDCYSDELCD